MSFGAISQSPRPALNLLVNRSSNLPESDSLEAYPHWARFAVDGRLQECSDWLNARWKEAGLLDVAQHARDFFYLSDPEGETFYRAWIGAVKGERFEERLRLLGRERSAFSCVFLPEYGGTGRVDSVLIQFQEKEARNESTTLGVEMFASALRSISEPIALIDRRGSVSWANHAFCQFFEVDSESLVGRAMIDSLGAELSDHDRSQYAGNLKRRCDFHQTVRKRSRSGSMVGLELKANLLDDPSDSRYVVRCSLQEAAIAEDRSALGLLDRIEDLFTRITPPDESLEKALRSARAEIEQLQGQSEAKTEFLANMSHEIRTPMNAVVGFCDLMMSTRLDEEQSEYVEAIYQSGQLLIQLIGQVLDYSKIESGHLELETEEFLMEQLILEVQAIMGARLRAKELSLRIDFDDQLALPVVGDATRIKQILINLLGNAYKFTRRGEIALVAETRASEHEEYLLLHVRVEDTGIGIDEGRIDSLFNPFAQANSRIAKDYGGTGLGLAICKRLCTAMRGDIWVESTSKAHGSVFVFEIHLPLSKVEQVCEEESESMNQLTESEVEMDTKSSEEGKLGGKSQGPLRVLVVDDNPNNLLITSKLSEHLGYRPMSVCSGVDAIAKLKEDSFDIVLMDVRMAPINGMETTRKIRDGEAGEHSRDSYIIALTAHALQGDREKCLAAGMNDYLSKPLTLEKLEESLTRAKSSLSLD